MADNARIQQSNQHRGAMPVVKADLNPYVGNGPVIKHNKPKSTASSKTVYCYSPFKCNKGNTNI